MSVLEKASEHGFVFINAIYVMDFSIPNQVGYIEWGFVWFILDTKFWSANETYEHMLHCVQMGTTGVWCTCDGTIYLYYKNGATATMKGYRNLVFNQAKGPIILLNYKYDPNLWKMRIRPLVDHFRHQCVQFGWSTISIIWLVACEPLGDGGRSEWSAICLLFSKLVKALGPYLTNVGVEDYKSGWVFYWK